MTTMRMTTKRMALSLFLAALATAAAFPAACGAELRVCEITTVTVAEGGGRLDTQALRIDAVLDRVDAIPAAGELVLIRDSIAEEHAPSSDAAASAPWTEDLAVAAVMALRTPCQAAWTAWVAPWQQGAAPAAAALREEATELAALHRHLSAMAPAEDAGVIAVSPAEVEIAAVETPAEAAVPAAPAIAETSAAFIPEAVKKELGSLWGEVKPAESAPAPVPALAKAAPGALPADPAFTTSRALLQGAAWEQKIDLDLRDARIADILRLFAQAYKVNVVAVEELEKKATITLHDIPLADAFDLILRVNGYKYEVENNVVVVRSGHGNVISRVIQLNHANPEPAEVEKNLESVEAILASYMASAKINGKLSVLKNPARVVVMAPAEDIERLEAMIRDLDRRPRQVLIQASIIAIDSSSLFNLGIQWGAPGESSRSGISVTETKTTGTDETGAPITSDRQRTHLLTFDKPPYPLEILTGNFNFPGPSSSLNGGQVTLGGWVDQLVFDASIDALVSKGKAKVLSQPRIGVLSHEKAKIVVGQKVKYDLSTTATGAGNVIEDSEFVEAGITLEVTPIVGNDDYVTIKLKPSVSSFIGDITTAESPPIQTTEAETVVCVRDGKTAVIGGLVTRTDSDIDTGLPGLRRIPLLRFLTSSRSRTWQQQEIIVLITPTIVETGDQWSERGADLAKPAYVPWKKNPEHLEP